MKHAMIALVFWIPAAAVGQTVTCDDCTHVVPVYMGEGGLIATYDDASDDTYRVTWVATCGNVTRSGELAANDDDTVAVLLSMDNGLACMAEGGGSFEIGPVKDGGWFWITEADNSAVGGLIAKDVLENDTVDITSAGNGVSLTEGKGAVYLKEAATGRVGILPNILPEPEMDPSAVTKCGYTGAGTAASPYERLATNCAMGDGGTAIEVTYEHWSSGRTTRVPDGGSITRPHGHGTVFVTIDLWGNGSGHFHCGASIPCDDDPSQSSVMLGQLDVVRKGLIVPNAADFSQSRSRTRLSGAYFSIEEGYGTPGSPTATIGNCPGASPCDATRAGISADFQGLPDVVTLGIRRDPAYCNNNDRWSPARVTVTAAIGEAGSLSVRPQIERDTSKSIGTSLDSPSTVAGVTATTQFIVQCPYRCPGQYECPDDE